MILKNKINRKNTKKSTVTFSTYYYLSAFLVSSLTPVWASSNTTQGSNTIHSQTPPARHLAIQPFMVSAELPVSIGLGLPKALSSQTIAAGETQWSINGSIQSHANDAGARDEELLLDGETHRIDFSFHYGLSERWQLDSQFAYIRHTAGQLDSLIQNWHDLLGVSDGDRPEFQQDNLLFSYQDTIQNASLDQSVSGISDIRIGVAYSLKPKEQPTSAYSSQWLLRAGFNLPTGDAAKLTGSDKADFDIGLYGSSPKIGRFNTLGWHANLGYLYIGDKQAFGIKTQTHNWFTSTGLHWAMRPNLQIKAQLDAHSALFDSAIDELARSAVLLTLGGSYRSPKHRNGAIFDWYISEDLTVNRAADFTFGMAMRHHF